MPHLTVTTPHPGGAEQEDEEFDLVAVGRALLSDPQWAIKARAGGSADLKGFSPAALGELV